MLLRMKAVVDEFVQGTLDGRRGGSGIWIQSYTEERKSDVADRSCLERLNSRDVSTFFFSFFFFGEFGRI